MIILAGKSPNKRWVRVIVEANLSANTKGNGNKARRRMGLKPINLKSPHGQGMNQEEFYKWFLQKEK